jgi:hypothetical protein
MDDSKILHVFKGEEAEDFSTWKGRIDILLERRGLDHCILKRPDEEDFNVIPANETAAAKTTREAKILKRKQEDLDAKEAIVNRLGYSVFRSVQSEKTAKGLMDRLVQMYMKCGPAVRRGLRRQMTSLCLRSFPNLKALFEQHEKLLREMDEAGITMSYEDKLHSLLDAVPTAYEALVSSYETMDDEQFSNVSLASMKRKFLDAEMKKNSLMELENPDVAMIGQRGRKTGSGNFNPKLNIKCFGCGEFEHKRFQCPKKNGPKSDEEIKIGGRQKFPINKKDGLMSVSGGMRRVPMVLDSGASDHMVNDERLLVEVQKLEVPVKIGVAKQGQDVEATRKEI